eukprot:g5185.t1 g5185   contig19:116136-117317(-)
MAGHLASSTTNSASVPYATSIDAPFNVSGIASSTTSDKLSGMSAHGVSPCILLGSDKVSGLSNAPFKVSGIASSMTSDELSDMSAHGVSPCILLGSDKVSGLSNAPHKLSGIASSTTSDELSDMSAHGVSPCILLDSDEVSGLSNAPHKLSGIASSTTYDELSVTSAHGVTPCNFSPSVLVGDLLDSDEVSDLSVLVTSNIMCGTLNVDVTLAYADDTDEPVEGSVDDPTTSGTSTQGAVVASSTQVGITRRVGPPGHLTDFKWTISGRSDSNYAADIDDRRSVTGCHTFLNGAPVMFRSATQRFVTLSVTEAESAAGVTEAQDMLYAYNIIKSLGLKVELPMILEMDNKGAVDLANSWRIGGRTRHIDVRMHFLRELKSQGLLLSDQTRTWR